MIYGHHPENLLLLYKWTEEVTFLLLQWPKFKSPPLDLVYWPLKYQILSWLLDKWQNRDKQHATY
jgi:hypothetical protein